MEEDEEANVGTGLFHFHNPYSIYDDDGYTICSFYEAAHYLVTLLFFIIASFYFFFLSSLLVEHMVKDNIKADFPFGTKHYHFSNQPVISICNVQYNSTIYLNICRELSGTGGEGGSDAGSGSENGNENENSGHRLVCNQLEMPGTNISNVIPCITLNRNDDPTLWLINSFNIEVAGKPQPKSQQVILGVIPHKEKDVIDSNNLVRHLFAFNLTDDSRLEMKVPVDNNWDFSYLGNQINFDGLISYWQILTFP